jgi:hypothetical protein
MNLVENKNLNPCDVHDCEGLQFRLQTEPINLILAVNDEMTNRAILDFITCYTIYFLRSETNNTSFPLAIFSKVIL